MIELCVGVMGMFLWFWCKLLGGVWLLCCVWLCIGGLGC